MFITEKINREYKEWKAGDTVFISSPTGSGKTTFILKELLPFVALQGKKILYFVNRRILYNQLIQELSNDVFAHQQNIRIMTYQSLENLIRYNDLFKLSILKSYDMVVCDEAHYFLSDSVFNTNTDLSFEWINVAFNNSVRIYLSATIYDIRKRLDIDCDNPAHHCGVVGLRTKQEAGLDYESRYTGYAKDIINNGVNVVNRMITPNIWIYSLDNNNNQLDIELVVNYNDVELLIMGDMENKWLVFVDSITYGKKLKRNLEKMKKDAIAGTDNEDKKRRLNDFKIEFLSAGYDDIDSLNQKLFIEKNKMQTANVLIATSVMDNGVSLKDCKLKNIILLADTEVEFLQMLGRKRREAGEENIKLYIYKYDKEHFQKRKEEVSTILGIHRDIEKQKENFREYYRTGYIVGYASEEYYVESQWQKFMLDAIFNKQVDFEKVRKILRAQNGTMVVNNLSVGQFRNLYSYYERITKLFEEGDDYAFVKEQLRWLGWDTETIEQRTKAWSISIEERCVNKINEIIGEKVGKQITKTENLEIKSKISNELKTLIENIKDEDIEKLEQSGIVKKRGEGKKTKKKKLLDWIIQHKTDHPITEEHMKILGSIYSIEYTVRNVPSQKNSSNPDKDKKDKDSQDKDKKETIYIFSKK
jgi:hypothetical protein